MLDFFAGIGIGMVVTILALTTGYCADSIATLTKHIRNRK